jgi:DNA-binding HxlR family transcriptional regulator
MTTKPQMAITPTVDEAFCPVEATLDILDGKWTMLILRDLFGANRRFSELRRLAKGISPKMLSERLRVLEEHGIITRTVYPEIPPRVEYALTPYGQSLRPILEAMAAWGYQHTQRRQHQ